MQFRFMTVACSTFTATFEGAMSVDELALAAADFQLVLSHRGAAAAEHSTVYPMAEIGLAHARLRWAMASSSAAYYRFIELWKDAECG